MMESSEPPAAVQHELSAVVSSNASVLGSMMAPVQGTVAQSSPVPSQELAAVQRQLNATPTQHHTPHTMMVQQVVSAALQQVTQQQPEPLVVPQQARIVAQPTQLLPPSQPCSQLISTPHSAEPRPAQHLVVSRQHTSPAVQPVAPMVSQHLAVPQQKLLIPSQTQSVILPQPTNQRELIVTPTNYQQHGEVSIVLMNGQQYLKSKDHLIPLTKQFVRSPAVVVQSSTQSPVARPLAVTKETPAKSRGRGKGRGAGTKNNTKAARTTKQEAMRGAGPGTSNNQLRHEEADKQQILRSTLEGNVPYKVTVGNRAPNSCVVNMTNAVPVSPPQATSAATTTTMSSSPLSLDASSDGMTTVPHGMTTNSHAMSNAAHGMTTNSPGMTTSQPTPVNTPSHINTPINTHSSVNTPVNTPSMVNTPAHANTHSMVNTPVNTHSRVNTPVNTPTMVNNPAHVNTHSRVNTPVNTPVHVNTPSMVTPPANTPAPVPCSPAPPRQAIVTPRPRVSTQLSSPSTPMPSAANHSSPLPPTPPTIQSNPRATAPPASGQQWVKGQEYEIKYANGRRVMGEWDGKYFKVKMPGSSTSKPASQGQGTPSPSLGTLGQGQSTPSQGAVQPALTRTPHVTKGLTQSQHSPQLNPAAVTSQDHSSETKPEGDAAPRVAVKRPLKAVDGKLAMCDNCGVMSADYITCEGCKKPLPEEPRFYQPPASKIQKKVEKVPVKTKASGDAGVKPAVRTVVLRSGRNAARVSQTKKTRNKAHQQPEMVTILSSDDEEGEGKARSDGVFSESGAPSPHPHHHRLSHKQRMEDEKGHVAGVGGAKKAEEEEPEEGPISVAMHDVRVGTMRSELTEPLVITKNEFNIRFTAQEHQKFNMVLAMREIHRVDASFGARRATLFLHTSNGCGMKIRESCKLSPMHGPYFDPCSKEECFRFIILTLNTSNTSFVPRFRSLCQAVTAERLGTGDWGDDQSFITEMSPSALNQRLLVCTTTYAGLTDKKQRLSRSQDILQNAFQLLVPPAGDDTAASPQLYIRQLATDGNMEEGEEEELMDRSRSPSPPRSVFNAPIIKLFTYPPPPATGGITVTNEDLFCLNEGEFLNDVIIDFYLKYIFNEHLSDEQKQKSHFFSSFFYRRLTQKQTHRQAGKDPPNMTMPRRRHSRVKTWTRHVDLFEKDFIVVPINESAHWYLAVICFPGLREPLVQPADTPATTPQTTDTTEDMETDSPPPTDQTPVNTTPTELSNGAASDNSQDSVPVTRSTTRSKTVSKQPCILIFDSLSGLGRSGVVRTLREYLQVEWDVKRAEKDGARTFDKDNMRGANPRCPQQTNFSDCGIYVLQYVENFFVRPILDYSLPMKHLATWFNEAESLSKREDLRSLILGLQEGLNPDLQYDPTEDGCLPLAMPDAGLYSHDQPR